MTLAFKKVTLSILAASTLFLMSCSNKGSETITEPTEIHGDIQESQKVQYTWEEFENMSAEEQMAFQNSFESIEAFDDWLQSVQPVEQIDVPWENGGKQLDEYTLEEFEALTMEQQMAFQNSFENFDAFSAWVDRVQSDWTVEVPWEDGGKELDTYTWEEFENLSGEQQIAFQNSFESFEQFDAWLQQAQDSAVETITLPTDCSWEEFENMTGEEQMIFQNSFESIEAFDAWLQQAQTEVG